MFSLDKTVKRIPINLILTKMGIHQRWIEIMGGAWVKGNKSKFTTFQETGNFSFFQ